MAIANESAAQKADEIARNIRDMKPSGFDKLAPEDRQAVLEHMETDTFKSRNPDHAKILEQLENSMIANAERWLRLGLKPVKMPAQEAERVKHDLLEKLRSERPDGPGTNDTFRRRAKRDPGQHKRGA
ncbi:MAG: hypothetical protein AB7L92_00795 [Alphaproteobacteria bacterium]